MTDSYKPIACSLHDEYEIAIMQRKCLNIKWSDSSGVKHTEKVLPIDILVKNKEEFLVVETPDHKELCVRLDKITLLEDRAGK
jgi:transcriptional antiterminator Rof (Rho-off)